MDADILSTSMPPPAPAQPSAQEPSAVLEQSSIFEPSPAPMQPPASAQPPALYVLQQLVADVHRLSERHQLVINRLDTFSRDHQQLRSDFQIFQQQSIDQQLKLIYGQHTLFRL